MSISLAHRNANRAILLAFIAYAFYSTGDAMLKIMAHHVAAGAILTGGGIITCSLALSFLAARGQVSALWQTPKIKLHLARSCAVGTLVLCALTALRNIPLPDFYGILFMAPFVVSVLAHVLFHEEVGLHRIIGMVIGFIGVIVLAGPTFHDPNIGYFITFFMLFVVASHMLIARRIGTSDPWPLLAFFPGLGMLLVGVPLLITYFELPDLHYVPMIIVYGLCIFSGQIAFSNAYTLAPLTAIIAPYVYTQMLWGLLYGYLLFNHVPSYTTAIGGAIIIASGLGNILYERMLRRRHLLGARAARRAEAAAPLPSPANQSL